jgi:predicted RNA-binding protein Jag
MVIEDELRMETGLGQSIISDEQFNQLKEQLAVDDTDNVNKLNINKATRTELTNLGLDKYLANNILDYRNKIGKFEKLEELKNIRGTIFEEQPAEAIITQRLARIVKTSGIRKIDRLDPKLVPGKKTETISPEVKKLFIDEIYLNELENEIQNLEKDQVEESEKISNRQKRQFESLPDVIPDELKLNIARNIIASKGKVELKSVESEGATKEEAVQLALYKLRANEEGVYVEVLDEGKKGFLGFLARPVKVRVTKKEDEQSIIAIFRESLIMYNEELVDVYSDEGLYTDYSWDEDYYDEYYGSEIKKETTVEYDTSEIEQSDSDEDESGEASSEELSQVDGSEMASISEAETPTSEIKEDIIDEDIMISALAEYLIKVSQKKNELRNWLYSIPISYQTQSYVVEMAFKCEMGQLVNVMYKIESSFRWLSVRDLKISIANQQKPVLSAKISVLATVL